MLTLDLCESELRSLIQGLAHGVIVLTDKTEKEALRKLLMKIMEKQKEVNNGPQSDGARR